MRCKRCGAEARAGNSFCERCGAVLENDTYTGNGSSNNKDSVVPIVIFAGIFLVALISLGIFILVNSNKSGEDNEVTSSLVVSSESTDSYWSEDIDSYDTSSLFEDSSMYESSSPSYSSSSSEEDNDDGFIFPNSDTEVISKSDLYDLSDWELMLARNEIYARRGYIFEMEALKKYFEEKDWYTPSVKAKDFTASMLNDVEAKNINLIVDYEKSRK